MKKIPMAPEDRCIACTTCTVVCPVASKTPNFLGPRMMGPALERFRLTGFGEDDSLHYCSNCKNCEIACPNDVPIATFIMRARGDLYKEKRPPLRDWVLAHGATVGWLLTYVPAVLKNFGMNMRLTRIILDMFGVARKAPLPSFAKATFHKEFAKIAQPSGLPRKVAFFPGCFVDLYDPECGKDIVWMLNRAGYEVLLPKAFSCCGLPMIANGFWEDARKNAHGNLGELAQLRKEGIPVLTGCTSCGLMVKADYRELFPEEVSAVSESGSSPDLLDVCEFLLGALMRGELSVPEKAGAKRRVIYHAPCHLRAQGIGQTGLDLMNSVTGLEAVEANAGCCGISGSYGFKKEKYAISMQIGADLFKAIRESGADISASECGTCRVQMMHGSGMKAVHPVTILRQLIEAAEK